jgi:hypothetical protein
LTSILSFSSGGTDFQEAQLKQRAETARVRRIKKKTGDDDTKMTSAAVVEYTRAFENREPDCTVISLGAAATAEFKKETGVLMRYMQKVDRDGTGSSVAGTCSFPFP